MSRDSILTSEESLRRELSNGLLLRKNVIESRLKDGKMANLPQTQLPISSYGTMYSSSQYDKMLKKKELITADTQLLYKKQEFATRMNDIEKNKVASKQKWNDIRERFESFVPYIEEDRAKKLKTLQKYKLELQKLNKKEQELLKLKEELQMVTEKNTALQNKVKKYQVYADFLSMIGKKYLTQKGMENIIIRINGGTTFSDGASPCQAVIKRHQTLVNTHADILSNISVATTELDKCQRNMEKLQNHRAEQVSNLREEASRLKRRLDYLINRNAAMQDEYLKQKQTYCDKVSQVSAILRAIDNLAWLCCKPQAIRGKVPDNIDTKLKIIQYGIISKQDVIKSIKRDSPA